MCKDSRYEKLLWSIAFPGFGQILNGHIIKGIMFILLEFFINIMSNLNMAIISSFQGNTHLASNQVNYQYLMFYPCVYIFAIWDAYKHACGEDSPYYYLPFVFSAYIGTIGVIFSSTFAINGMLLGPIWLPIISLILGALIGYIIKFIALSIANKNN